MNEEEGRFESVFTLSANWNETDSPTASSLSGSQTRTQSITPGIRMVNARFQNVRPNEEPA